LKVNTNTISLYQSYVSKQCEKINKKIVILGMHIYLSFGVLSREATNTNFIVFTLTRSGLEPTTGFTKPGEVGDFFALISMKSRKNLGDFRKSIQILTFLSPLPHVSLPFTKMNVLLYDLKKDAINEFGINY
jgi:hypothetical protein